MQSLTSRQTVCPKPNDTYAQLPSNFIACQNGFSVYSMMVLTPLTSWNEVQLFPFSHHLMSLPLKSQSAHTHKYRSCMCACSDPPDLFSFLSVASQTRRSWRKEALISLTGLCLLLFIAFFTARTLCCREEESCVLISHHCSLSHFF